MLCVSDTTSAPTRSASSDCKSAPQVALGRTGSKENAAARMRAAVNNVISITRTGTPPSTSPPPSSVVCVCPGAGVASVGGAHDGGSVGPGLAGSPVCRGGQRFRGTQARAGRGDQFNCHVGALGRTQAHAHTAPTEQFRQADGGQDGAGELGSADSEPRLRVFSVVAAILLGSDSRATDAKPLVPGSSSATRRRRRPRTRWTRSPRRCRRPRRGKVQETSKAPPHAPRSTARR